jgi:DNA segregation ATPase FtsK/SpoIIIE, S-DNA-T family
VALELSKPGTGPADAVAGPDEVYDFEADNAFGTKAADVDVEVPEAGLRERVVAQVRTGRARARARVGDWTMARELDDADQALAEVRVDRDRRNEKAISAHHSEMRMLRKKMTALAQAGDEKGAAQIGIALESMKVAGPMLVEDDVTRRDVERLRWQRRLTRIGMLAAGGYGALTLGFGHPLMLPVEIGGALVAVWQMGKDRPEEEPLPGPSLLPAQQVMAPDRTAEMMSLVQPAPWSAGDSGEAPVPPVPDVPLFDAPPPPALSEETLLTALKAARIPGFGPDSTVKILAAPAWGEDGTATTVFDMPVTVSAVQKKLDELAGALGRSRSMIDVTKAGAENRASLWLSDSDPFDKPRPSPLLKHTGGLDAWRDGVPVGYTKRGAVIALPIKNSSFVIAGMTRSGKGVGASNLLSGAALDVRINLRIVAGKVNGEFDAYARAGVAATYFKQSPARLRALLKAWKDELNRRNAILGELGKSKMTPETIMRLGGIELLVIDELRTFTAKEKEDRDEILADLIELSAVAAGAGMLLILITQYPEVEVIPTALAMNCGSRWAMRVDTAQQSNTILGGGASAAGRDASKFDPPTPGLGWLVNPFAGVTDLARSFDLDEDERGEISLIMQRAAALREGAGRLVGQWDDPIERALVAATGLSSAAGGPDRNGIPGRPSRQLSPEQAEAHQMVVAAVAAADALGHDVQLDDVAVRVGVSAERVGELLRRAGAGPTGKVTIPGRGTNGRVNGYTRAQLSGLLDASGA